MIHGSVTGANVLGGRCPGVLSWHRCQYRLTSTGS